MMICFDGVGKEFSMNLRYELLRMMKSKEHSMHNMREEERRRRDGKRRRRWRERERENEKGIKNYKQ